MVEMVAMELDIKFSRPTRRPKVDNDHNQLMERRKVNEETTETSSSSSCKNEALAPRPPVVCLLGHVDHGKTTLMDALRRRSQIGGSSKKKKAKKGKKGGKVGKPPDGDVAGTEAGGITQVISAFQVPLGGQTEALTFLDTPGHAAFSAMRQSGSHAADIIVLVIAADDGVSQQTIEILNFYKSIVKGSDGGISLVVAMNKIDKPGIVVDECRRRIENQLLEHAIIPEGVSHSNDEYGSPVQFFPISAKTGEGLDDLIEGLALQSEIMDLRADVTARAEGIVMDARKDQGIGVVADCIIRWGSIQRSDVVVSGTHMGKVKVLKDGRFFMFSKSLCWWSASQLITCISDTYSIVFSQ
jgi:translation initiation factor IF-2